MDDGDGEVNVEPWSDEDVLPRPQRSGMWKWIALAVVVAVIAVVAAFVLIPTDDDDAPSAWDPRIADLAAYVERDRGLTFKHPVKAEFLAEDDFRKKVTSDDALTKEDEEELVHAEGIFRALGLIEGRLDLRDAIDQLTGEAVIGLYEPKAKTIYIRGNEITPEMRPTVVHELTHALQDQEFDLDLDLHPSGADAAFTAVIEADALRIEDDYKETLTEEERRAVDSAEAAMADGVDLEGVPRILTELFQAPYVLGPPFLDAIERERGKKGIDQAFTARTRPSTEEHIANPQAYFDGDNASKVETPKLRSGEKRVGDPDDFGMISLLLVLGERLSFPQAWAAVDGWKGDASIGYSSDGKDCLRVRVQVDSSSDGDELEQALQAWGEGRPTTTTRVGPRMVEFASCDPGAAAAAASDPNRPRTFDLLAFRSQIVSTLQESGATGPQAACVADDVLQNHDAAKLVELFTIQDENDPRIVAIQRDVAAAVARCRG